MDFGARIYDSRVGRWLSLDPLQKKYPSLSPYNFAANSPLYFVDVDGKDIFVYGEQTFQFVLALQAATSLTVTYDLLASQVTITGIPTTATDFALLEASEDHNIHVTMYATDANLFKSDHYGTTGILIGGGMEVP